MSFAEEAFSAIDQLKACVNKPVSLRSKLNAAIINIMWTIITGQSFDYDDPKFKEVAEKLEQMLTVVSWGGPINIWPWLKHIIPKWSGYTVYMGSQLEVLKIIDKIYKEHVKAIDRFAIFYLQEVAPKF